MRIVKSITNIICNVIDDSDKIIANFLSSGVDISAMSSDATKAMRAEQQLQQRIEYNEILLKYPEEAKELGITAE